MSYIVLDLEWNQAMSSNASVFNRLPIHLSGEIIQIGAVKLDDDFCPAEEFQSDVRPIYFRSMHYKVKKLTGIDKERLSHGDTFPTVFEHFREWCGEDRAGYRQCGGNYPVDGCMFVPGSVCR